MRHKAQTGTARRLGFWEGYATTTALGVPRHKAHRFSFLEAFHDSLAPSPRKGRHLAKAPPEVSNSPFVSRMSNLSPRSTPWTWRHFKLRCIGPRFQYDLHPCCLSCLASADSDVEQAWLVRLIPSPSRGYFVQRTYSTYLLSRQKQAGAYYGRAHFEL